MLYVSIIQLFTHHSKGPTTPPYPTGSWCGPAGPAFLGNVPEGGNKSWHSYLHVVKRKERKKYKLYLLCTRDRVSMSFYKLERCNFLCVIGTGYLKAPRKNISIWWPRYYIIVGVFVWRLSWTSEGNKTYIDRAAQQWTLFQCPLYDLEELFGSLV